MAALKAVTFVMILVTTTVNLGSGENEKSSLYQGKSFAIGRLNYSHNNYAIHGENAPIRSYGAGGAGGGSRYESLEFGNGGNGASGIVIIKW